MSDFDDKFDEAYAKWKAANPGAVGMFATKPSSQVNTPQDVGKAVLGAVKRNAIPLAGLGATGAALDYLFPEPTAALIAARAGLMGLANVAMNKTVPEALGGNKEMSLLGGFAGGALPEVGTLGGGRLASNILERNLNRRVEGATANAVGKLDKNAVVAEDTLMAPSRGVPKTFAQGPELTNQTFAAQAPINATIDAARTKYGAPIGEAYRTLKGDTTISADGFAQFADNLRGDMISPTSANANALLKRFRDLDPEAQKEGLGTGANAILNANAATTAPMVELPGGEMIARPTGKTAFRNELGKRAATFHAAPTTLDTLRNLRQQVNTQLRTAQGGDRYMLSALQDKLDAELMPHLPKEMDQLRKTYAGFMKRWSYRDQQALSKLTDPQQVADFLFSDPVKAHDLMSEASPMQQGQLRDQFLQHVYGSLNDTDPIAKQVSEVRKRLAPYMKDEKSAVAVLGPNAGTKMREMISWPKFTEDFKRSMEKNPEFKAKFIAGVKQSILERRMDPDQAAVEMIRQIGGPESSPTNLVDMMKTLPAPASKSGGNNSWRNMAIGRHLAMAGMYGGAALGGAHMGMGMAYQIGALGTFLAADRMASFSAASKLGITAPLLRAMSTKNGYIAGRALSRTLLNAGARDIQSGANEPVELY